MITSEEIVGALKHVIHPAIGTSIVELNMVSDVSVNGRSVAFTLTFAKAHDPMKNSVVKACERALRSIVHPDIEPHITVKSMQTVAEASKKKNPGAKNIIAVASGKGGVGKSTVATNLAVALSKMGYSAGLLDADVYGPSVPRMLGMEGVRPSVKNTEAGEIIVPVERFGVKVLSIGFFVRTEDAIIWRGPMATSAVRQLINQGEWGELDYLIIDLPPGTGDMHLTIVQEFPVTGAIIVSTPQEVALADAIRCISMFRSEKINVPILGLIENMSWFTPEELPEHRYYIFGNGGCKALAERAGVRLLGQIPVVQGICQGGDDGQPVVADEKSITGKAFMELAHNTIEATYERNKNMPPTIPLDVNK